MNVSIKSLQRNICARENCDNDNERLNLRIQLSNDKHL